MTTDDFAQQIEYLLLTGALRGREILKLHRLLKSYEHGSISASKMQVLIKQYDPDQWWSLTDESLRP